MQKPLLHRSCIHKMYIAFSALRIGDEKIIVNSNNFDLNYKTQKKKKEKISF